MADTLRRSLSELASISSFWQLGKAAGTPIKRISAYRCGVTTSRKRGKENCASISYRFTSNQDLSRRITRTRLESLSRRCEIIMGNTKRIRLWLLSRSLYLVYEGFMVFNTLNNKRNGRFNSYIDHFRTIKVSYKRRHRAHDPWFTSLMQEHTSIDYQSHAGDPAVAMRDCSALGWKTVSIYACTKRRIYPERIISNILGMKLDAHGDNQSHAGDPTVAMRSCSALGWL